MVRTRLHERRAGFRLGIEAFLLLASLSSCRLLQSAVEAPGKVLTPKGDEPPPPSAVQNAVMRFTDRFDAEIVQSTKAFADAVGTNEARIQALEWSIAARSGALDIASAPNPNLNLIDMLVLVTLGRISHEDHWMPKVWHEADRPVLEAYQALEAEIWDIASKFLEQKHLDEVRTTIFDWREENPDQIAGGAVRLRGFWRIAASRREKDPNVFESLGKMLSLDPLAGLEPAKREVAEARILGERVLFYGQRAPLVFASQAELLGLKLAGMPQVEAAIENTGKISQAATSLSETAAGLPEAVRAEREALVAQVSEELAKQREGLVRDLETSEEPVRRILADSKETAEALRSASAQIQDGIRTLDQFIANVSADTPDDGGPPGRPFDVREYGEAASRITEAAKELNGLLRDVEANESGTGKLLDEAAARGDAALERATRRLVVGGLILIGAGAAAVLLVRWISSRWIAPRTVAPHTHGPDGHAAAERGEP